MSIESLVDKIIADSRLACSRIEKRASDEVKACEAEGEREAQRIVDEAKERAARRAMEQRQRMISMAELEDRKEVLGAKQQMIEDAFGRAIERILSLHATDYGNFLIKLILQADPEGDEEVLFNAKDRDRLGDGWIKPLNQSLDQNKRKAKMTIAKETRSMQGGVILRRGRKEINCSLESVILSKRNELETKVAAILFRDGE